MNAADEMLATLHAREVYEVRWGIFQTYEYYLHKIMI